MTSVASYRCLLPCCSMHNIISCIISSASVMSSGLICCCKLPTAFAWLRRLHNTVSCCCISCSILLQNLGHERTLCCRSFMCTWKLANSLTVVVMAYVYCCSWVSYKSMFFTGCFESVLYWSTHTHGHLAFNLTAHLSGIVVGIHSVSFAICECFYCRLL